MKFREFSQVHTAGETKRGFELKSARHPSACSEAVLHTPFQWRAVLQFLPGVLDVLTRTVLAAPLPHSHISEVTIWVREMQNSCILLPLGLMRWNVCDWQLLTGKLPGIFLDFLNSMVWFECSGFSSTCLLHNKFLQVKKKKKAQLGHWEDMTSMKMSGVLVKVGPEWVSREMWMTGEQIVTYKLWKNSSDKNGKSSLLPFR